MFKYFKPYIPRGIIAALFKMGESFADLTLPLIMAKVIDIGVSNKDFEYILLQELSDNTAKILNDNYYLIPLFLLLFLYIY